MSNPAVGATTGQPAGAGDIGVWIDGAKLNGFHLLIVLLSFLIMLSDGYDLSVLAYAAPGLLHSLHAARSQLGPVFSASLIGMLAGAPVLGYVGDRFGRKTAIIAGGVVYGVGMLAASQIAAFGALMPLRILVGLGLGGLLPNTVALNAEFAPKRMRATLVVLMFMGITLGGMAPGALSAVLPPHAWRMLFAVGGIAPLVVCLLLFAFLPESAKFLARKGKTEQALRILRRLRPDLGGEILSAEAIHPPPASATRVDAGILFGPELRGTTLLLWAIGAANLMANYFLNSWMPLLFEDAGVSAKAAALTMSLYYLGGIAGGLIISRWIDARGAQPLKWYFALACPSVIAIGLHGLPHGALPVAVFASGFSVLGAQLGLNAFSGLVYPTEVRALGAGWANAIGRLGAIFGPVVGGWLIAAKTPRAELFVAPAIPLALGAVAALALSRHVAARSRLAAGGKRAPAATGS